MKMTGEKTPISVMNELCKCNNMLPEYEVIEEDGPPHNRTFTVSLTLPDVGTYEGVGRSIKAAKHKAAELGLTTSGLTRKVCERKYATTQPAVALNNLATKHGKTVVYQNLSQSLVHPGTEPIPSNGYNPYNNPYYQRIPLRRWTVSLTMNDKEYLGYGTSLKLARSNAAEAALVDLQEEIATRGKIDEESGATAPNNTATSNNESSVKPIKSDVSRVYEIASKHKMKIDFEIVSASGPPHSRLFITTVKVGDLIAKGEGGSKKISKHQASLAILPQLLALPVAAVKTRRKGTLYHYTGFKKRNKELDPSLNAISLLGQLRQRRKESLPVYTLISEQGVRNKEFTMQVNVDDMCAKATGLNKKEAKKNAAEAMLQLLGIRSKPSVDEKQENQVEQNQESGEVSQQNGEKNESCAGECHQLPPGLLPILPEMTNAASQNKPMTNQTAPSNVDKQSGPTITVLNRAPGAPVGKPINDEPILQNGSTPSMKTLEQLAESRGFQVKYQDSTQPENGDCLAVVTVSTVPQLICRGFGATIEQAFENAAANALVPLLQPPPPPSSNGQVTANGQRNIHILQEDSPKEGKP